MALGIAAKCRELFGIEMLGIGSIIASVALDRYVSDKLAKALPP